MEDKALLIRALELDRDGDWDHAHRIVQNLGGKGAARVHAYLHREEGDLGNADYWYGRSGESRPDIPLADEWQQLWDRHGGA